MSSKQSNLAIDILDATRFELQAPSSATKKGTGIRVRQVKTTQDAIAFARKKSQEAKERKSAAIEAQVLQSILPMWDDDNRGVPNPLVRSGLFSVKTSEHRDYLRDLHVSSLSNYEIRYSGVELRQDDLSVWMSLINMARQKPMSDALFFTGYQLVKDLGWRMHSESYRRAKESIERLKVTGLKVASSDGKAGYAGSLLRDYAWSEQDEQGNTKWMVRFEPRISSLFLEDTTTLLEWETRKQIGPRHALALWLHSFYSTHAEPFPISVETLWELCRSGDKLSSFRRNVKNALDKLVKVGFLSRYELRSDIVYVERIRFKLVAAKAAAVKGRPKGQG